MTEAEITALIAEEVDLGDEPPHMVTTSEATLRRIVRRASGGWRPMETAPRDGTAVLLFIEDAEHPFEDESTTVSIGSYGVEGGPEQDPTWSFAGWCWQQDCYCRGAGRPIGWMPRPAAPGWALPNSLLSAPTA
jgi:hypothetical protein